MPPAGYIDASTVQAMIDQAIARKDEQHAAEIADISTRLTAAEAAAEAANARVAGLITTQVPAHAGGPGIVIADTWSQWDQELAARGEHPLQLESVT